MNVVNNFRVCKSLGRTEYKGKTIYKDSYDGQVLFSVESNYFKTLAEAKRYVKGAV
jgi:hypothetical protein